MVTLTGWHGEARGTIVGTFAPPELYVAIERSLAEDYAGPDGRIMSVSYQADNPLILQTASAAAATIRASKMFDTPGKFHGHESDSASHTFAEWARAEGYDAVVFEPGAFEQADDSDAAYQDWDLAAGTFGDPQIIVLNPSRATITA